MSWLCQNGSRLEAADLEQNTNAITISPSVLNNLFEEARGNNLSLRAAEAKVSGSWLAADTVRNWEEPRFTLGGVLSGPRQIGRAHV